MPLQDGHGADFIVDAVMAQPDRTVTLCALGPLTNIALALEREPAIAGRVRELVLMGGGAFEGGNTTPAAEFNIYVDPHAARVVFAAGMPTTVFPLDCTHQALTSRERIAAFRALGTPVGEATTQLLEFFERFDEEKYGTDGGPLHDPNVIAWLLRPELYSGRDVNIEIETDSELTMGMTVVDWWGVTDRAPNVHFVRGLDSDGFFGLLTERLARL
jgi:purine nucleosidase